MTLQHGLQTESSFIRFLQREYEDLSPQKASKEDDLHYGTDCYISANGVRYAVGITTQTHKSKILGDKSKASRKFNNYVEVVFDTLFIEEEDMSWKQAFNNAAESLLNDLKKGYSYIVADQHGSEVKEIV